MVVKVRVAEGDIFHEPADAMVLAVNSTGIWNGQMDAAVMQAIGSSYHGELQAAMPLTDGDVVVAQGQPNIAPAFERIIFVIDDLVRPLDQIVGAGLRKAEDLGFAKVTLPTLRMGNMAGKYRSEDAISALVRAINGFVKDNPKQVQEVRVVVYNSRANANVLREQLFLM
jgi:O-acetyl-ADP-ribose deacetylase (regulator of RNase III)